MTDQGTNAVMDPKNARAFRIAFLRDIRHGFLPAGPFMAGRPLPVMIDRLDADGAVPGYTFAPRRWFPFAAASSCSSGRITSPPAPECLTAVARSGAKGRPRTSKCPRDD